MMSKEINLALDNLKNAEKLDPASRDVQFAFARYYAMQKDFTKSEDTVRKVIEKNPTDLEARALLGDLLVASGNIKRAEKEFAEIKKLAPRIPIGYVKSGELYIKQGKMERAIVEYEQALKANPDSWRVANDLAFLLGETSKDINRAVTLAEKARTLKPEELTVQDTLGWLYLKQGNTAKSLELLKPVQSKAPDAAVINYHLGMALYKAGKPQEAKDSLKKALSRKEGFPGREEAERTLAKI
jgi:tetratricopeptide (TPR) repeat protein